MGSKDARRWPWPAFAISGLLWAMALVWVGLWLTRWGVVGSLPRVLFRTVAPLLLGGALLLPSHPPLGRARSVAYALVGIATLLTLVFWLVLLFGPPEVFFRATALLYVPATFVMLSAAAVVAWWHG